MSCGNTSCLDQMGCDWTGLGESGSGSNAGFMQVAPERFTREELQAIRNKASDLLPWTNMAEFDLLEDLVETLDLLDAMAAREELDMHVMHNAPPCGPDCPYHPRIYGHGVGE